ncbi:unnamed protein product (mitochondrion) [Plasmodiophora brassicae]|uniref:RGS domain-containing protein n=1 Tax=Plasmodiophora brassicae TaxID=37360 RepID=A0A3P3YAY3_PLABS|nr:unnamed protein product [Plasmodiophora brassicae]
MFDYNSLYLVQLALTGYMPVRLYQYRCHRQDFPIRLWRHGFVTAAGWSLLFHIWVLCMSQAMEQFPVIAAAIPLMVTESITIDIFLLEAANVYRKLKTFQRVNKSGAVASMSTAGTLDTNREAPKVPSAARYLACLLTPAASILFIAVNAIVLQAIPCLVLFSRHQGLAFLPASECTNNAVHRGCVNLIIVVICKGVVSLLLAAFISFCLSGVQDSTGTKSGLKRVAVSYLLSYALYLVLTTLFGRTALSATNADVFGNLLILGFHAVFHFAITEPVVRAKRFAAESSPETYQDIHPFLSVPKWFDALYQHAITECNAENLLFWKSVQECDNGTASPIKRLSRIRSSRSLRRLGVKSDQPQMQFIYNTFIAPGAPLEVNLPADVTVSLHAYFKGLAGPPDACSLSTTQGSASSILNSSVYTDAVNAIEFLIAQDILPRFRSTAAGKAAWAEYEASRIERMALDSEVTPTSVAAEKVPHPQRGTSMPVVLEMN